MTMSLTADANNQKLRGGYYTPEVIARFLAGWAICLPSDEVLEPSCGDGSLLEAAARRLLQLGASTTQVNRQIRATELYEHDQAWGIAGEPCDVVIGNPPFLRYHAFPEDQRDRAFRIMQTAGLSPSKLTNSWVAFWWRPACELMAVWQWSFPLSFCR